MLTKRIFIFYGCLLLVVGFLLGFTTQNFLVDDQAFKQIQKLNRVFNLALKYYVDPLDSQKIVSAAIEGMLQELDPHSIYIPPQELTKVNEDIQGKFEGIGIEFDVISDTLVVVNPIADGPSILVGIQAGDRIIQIDDSSAVKITREIVPKKLRGPKGSKVKLKIQRPSTRQILDFVVVRDQITLFSVDTAFMLDKGTGLIKVNRFSATTFDEFKEALTNLKRNGMTRLILDLRGNPGGYLDQAVKMADEFLDGDKKIVFTKSRDSQMDETHLASNHGDFEKGSLVVLIDRNSASASEIVAGAIQDWDRGVIVGETSFGKGLVQKQFQLDEDNSAIRLTIARYYTPSGRLIQRSYAHGKEDYYNEVRNRKSNQLTSAYQYDLSDSTHPKYRTANERIVYGGGGITPDFFSSQDTLTDFAYALLRNNSFYEFIRPYMDKNREQIKATFSDLDEFVSKFEITETFFNSFINEAVKSGITKKDQDIELDKAWIKNYLKATIARQLWGNLGFYKVNSKIDQVLKSAQQLITNENLITESLSSEKMKRK